MPTKTALQAKPERKRSREKSKPDAAAQDATLSTGAVTTEEMKSVLGYMLRRAQVAVFHHFVTEGRHLNIRPTQIGVLSVIRENPGRKQAEICAALGIQRTNFVAIFDELERRGLAKRISAKNDRRAHALYLTEDGEKLVARWRAEQHKLEKQLIEIVGGEGNYRQLMQTLDKLADNLAPE